MKDILKTNLLHDSASAAEKVKSDALMDLLTSSHELWANVNRLGNYIIALRSASTAEDKAEACDGIKKTMTPMQEAFEFIEAAYLITVEEVESILEEVAGEPSKPEPTATS